MALIDTTIMFILYIIFAAVLVGLSIVIGPIIFKLLGYIISERQTVKASETISYFLQALLSVVIGFVALNK